MKKLFKIIIGLSVTFSALGQNSYQEKMQKAFKLWENSKIEKASTLFEHIAEQERENWLPYYYASLVNITSTFHSKNKTGINLKLKKAQENLNMAMLFSGNNPENMVLQALLFTADMLQDMPSKTTSLAPKIELIYEKAIRVAPKNPRVISSYTDWKYHKAKYLNKNTAPQCKAMEKLLSLFDTYKSDDPFGPSWGKERVVQLIAKCK